MSALREAVNPTNTLFEAIAVRGESGATLLGPDIEIRRFAAHEPFARPGERPEHVLFPLSAAFSAVVTMADGTNVHVASIGREGGVGVRWLLGGAARNLALRCCIEGEAICVPLATLRELYDRDASTRRILDRYFRARFDAMEQLIACSSVHRSDQRCARALLALTDNVDRDSISITQETLSEMLGIRRAGVNVTMALLSRGGAVAHVRGKVEVLDRARLASFACPCYGEIRAIYDDVVADENLSSRRLERRDVAS